MFFCVTCIPELGSHSWKSKSLQLQKLSLVRTCCFRTERRPMPRTSNSIPTPTSPPPHPPPKMASSHTGSLLQRTLSTHRAAIVCKQKVSVSNIILWILRLWMRLEGRICILCLRICVASPRYTPLSCPYLTKWRVTDEASIWGVFHAFSSKSLNIILLLQFILILLLI